MLDKDNGIFILRTLDGYRVALIDDYGDLFDFFDLESNDWPMLYGRVYDAFRGSTVYSTHEAALQAAKNMLPCNDCLEWGIADIKLNREMKFEELNHAT